MLRALFIIKVLRGEIDFQFLAGEINFNIPSRNTRNYIPLQLSLAK